MNKTIVKKFCILVFICLFMGLSSESVFASMRTGTLLIKRKSDAKIEVELYHVADYENGEYILKSSYHDETIINYHKGLCSNPSFHAQELIEYANAVVKSAHKQKIEPLYKGYLQKDTYFQNLDKGLYVFAQVDHKDDTKQILPAVIGIPYWQEITLDNGTSEKQLTYDVVMQLKESDVIPPKPSVKPSHPVDTGDDASHLKSIYRSMLIGSMIGIYWIRKYLNCEVDYEK